MSLKNVIANAAKFIQGTGAQDMKFDQETTRIVAKREEIQSQQKAAHQQLNDAKRQHAAATAERDRLQNACNKKKEAARPYAELGKAIIAADAAAEQLKAAEAEALRADTEAREKLSDLNRQENDARHKAAVAEFRAAVINYERAIQAGGLAALSDEIRRLAGLAGVRIEDHSPLIDDEYTVIGNYPLNVRTWSNPEGRNPIAATDDE